jgi:hypothetical protein
MSILVLDWLLVSYCIVDQRCIGCCSVYIAIGVVGSFLCPKLSRVRLSSQIESSLSVHVYLVETECPNLICLRWLSVVTVLL